MVGLKKLVFNAFQIIAFTVATSFFPYNTAVAQFGVEPTFSVGGELRVDTGDLEYLESIESRSSFRIDVDYYEDFCIVKIKGFPDFYGKKIEHPQNGLGCEFYPLLNTTMHINVTGDSLIASDPFTNRVFFRFVGGLRGEMLDLIDDCAIASAAGIFGGFGMSTGKH